MKHVTKLCAVISLVVPSVLVSAHHSPAAFDTAAEITLTGTVTAWRWVNPHVILRLDIKEDAGTLRQWAAESASPTNMLNQGWARTSFKAGDEVTVTLRPARNGEPVGQLVRVVVLATGRAYVTGGPPAGGTPNSPLFPGDRAR